MMIAAIATLEARPKPSQTTSSGAMAKTGMRLARHQQRPEGALQQARARHQRAPRRCRSAPTAKPARISERVMSACGPMTSKRVTSVAAMRDGGGSTQAGAPVQPHGGFPRGEEGREPRRTARAHRRGRTPGAGTRAPTQRPRQAWVPRARMLRDTGIRSAKPAPGRIAISRFLRRCEPDQVRRVGGTPLSRISGTPTRDREWCISHASVPRKMYRAVAWHGCSRPRLTA